VESISSALFAIEFYRQRDRDTAPAAALKRTQTWLRSVTYSELARWYKKQVISRQKNSIQEQPRQLLADPEYELLFFQLLTGVNDENWSHGRVKGFLDGKNIAEANLVQWLRRFGENLLASDGENRELAMRMVRLSEVDCKELGEVAGEIGRESLGKEGEAAEMWFERASQQADVEDFKGSISSLDQALKLKPDYHEAWLNRGSGLHNLGQYEEAITSCDEALKFKPDFHEAWHVRGTAMRKLGRYEDAIASYDQALKIKADYHDTWHDRGIALDHLQRFEDAIASYDQALKFKPDYHEAWYNRGIALGNLGRYEEAIASYDQALKFKPDYHEAWYNRGIALGNLGRYEEAIASFDQALKFKPDWNEAWYYRGFTMCNLQRFEEAGTAFGGGAIVSGVVTQHIDKPFAPMNLKYSFHPLVLSLFWSVLATVILGLAAWWLTKPKQNTNQQD
jgi:tetratricopeptide (TPR) repeat protein